MKGKTGYAFLVSFLFMVSAGGALAANSEHTDLSGKYVQRADSGVSWVSHVITIEKTDSGTYSVTIGGTAKGGMGPSTCDFYGTGTISGNFLLVSNTVTYKGKNFPVTFKIYCNRDPELDAYAKAKNWVKLGKLKPGQLAIIEEGGLPSQLPKELRGEWNWVFENEAAMNTLLLPNGEPMFSGGFMDDYSSKKYIIEASFSAIYTKIADQNPTKASSSSKRAAPSFDCSKASHPVEQAICADPALAELDVKFAAEYKRALNAAADKEALKLEQRKWLRYMHDQCEYAPPICIQNYYNERLSQIKQQTK